MKKYELIEKLMEDRFYVELIGFNNDFTLKVYNVSSDYLLEIKNHWDNYDIFDFELKELRGKDEVTVLEKGTTTNENEVYEKFYKIVLED